MASGWPFPDGCCGDQCPYCGKPCTLRRAHWSGAGGSGLRWHEHLFSPRRDDRRPWRGGDAHQWRLEGPAGEWALVGELAQGRGLFNGPSGNPEEEEKEEEERRRDQREAEAEAEAAALVQQRAERAAAEEAEEERKGKGKGKRR